MRYLGIIALFVFLLCSFSFAHAELLQIDIDMEDATIVNEITNSGPRIVLELQIPEELGNKKVTSCYLNLELSVSRLNNESIHSGEILCVGVSPVSNLNEIPDVIPVAEFSVLPGDNLAIMLDISKVVKQWLEESNFTGLLAIFGCDRFNDIYNLHIPSGLESVGWLDIRFIRLE